MQGQIKWRVCWASIIFTCVPQSNIMCNNWCFRNLQLLRFWQPCTLLWYHMHLLITTWIKSYQGASSADTECSKPANIANSSNSELGICPTAFNFEGLSPVFKGLIETSPDVGACLINLLLHLWMSIDLSCFLSTPLGYPKFMVEILKHLSRPLRHSKVASCTANWANSNLGLLLALNADAKQPEDVRGKDLKTFSSYGLVFPS